MKQSLLNIADALDKRVLEFEGFPRTQATDAMKGLGTDLANIIRAEAESMETGDINAMVCAEVTRQMKTLTAASKKSAPKKAAAKSTKKEKTSDKPTSDPK